MTQGYECANPLAAGGEPRGERLAEALKAETWAKPGLTDLRHADVSR